MKNRGMNTAPAVNRYNRSGVGNTNTMSNNNNNNMNHLKLKRNFSETAHDFGSSRAAAAALKSSSTNPRSSSQHYSKSTHCRSDSFTAGSNGGATELHRTESDSYSCRPTLKSSGGQQEADQQSAGGLSSALKLTLQKSDINYIKEILKKKDKNAISEIAAARTRSPSTAKNGNTNLSNRSKEKILIISYFNKKKPYY